MSFNCAPYSGEPITCTSLLGGFEKPYFLRSTFNAPSISLKWKSNKGRFTLVHSAPALLFPNLVPSGFCARFYPEVAANGGIFEVADRQLIDAVGLYRPSWNALPAKLVGGRRQWLSYLATANLKVLLGIVLKLSEGKHELKLHKRHKRVKGKQRFEEELLRREPMSGRSGPALEHYVHLLYGGESELDVGFFGVLALHYLEVEVVENQVAEQGRRPRHGAELHYPFDIFPFLMNGFVLLDYHLKNGNAAI